MIPAEDALARLRDGNRRFVAGSREICEGFRSSDPAAVQTPVAAILGCADSRVPPELVFDQSPGQLFVTRVAGAGALQAQVETLEFAVGALGVRLIVVLGHEGCVGVRTALDAPGSGRGYLGSIVAPLRAAMGDPPPRDHDVAVRLAVAGTCESLRRESAVLRQGTDTGELLIVGARYSLRTGVVEFMGEAETVGAT